MKYISVVILLVLMGWTWSLATTERPFRLEQHKAVEAGVEEDIRAFIQRKYPAAKEIFCTQLYTEIVNPRTDLIAHFRCQATGTPGEHDTAPSQSFEGFIKLRSNDDFRSWDEVGGEIRSPALRFEAIDVGPNAGAGQEKSEPPAAEPAHEAAPAAPAHEEEHK